MLGSGWEIGDEDCERSKKIIVGSIGDASDAAVLLISSLLVLL